jgi:hypothetical protein
VLNGLAVCKVKRVGKASFEDRIVAGDGVGIINDIAHADVIQENDGGERSVVELLIELLLLLDDFYF